MKRQDPSWTWGPLRGVSNGIFQRSEDTLETLEEDGLCDESYGVRDNQREGRAEHDGPANTASSRTTHSTTITSRGTVPNLAQQGGI